MRENVARLVRFAKRQILARAWNVKDTLLSRNNKQSDILYAFWDHKVAPATFDILAFLILAEVEREKLGCKSLSVVIVPGPDHGFRQGDLNAYNDLKHGSQSYDEKSMNWRMRNIEVACCSQLPSCNKVMICASREEARAVQASLAKFIFPKGYTVSLPIPVYQLTKIESLADKKVILPTLAATEQSRRFVGEWLSSQTKGRKVITITLRESLYEKSRNSNLKAWSDFARSLNKDVYCPVILRDTEVAFKPLPPELRGLVVFSEASWNVELRSALYELSYLNMFISNGPLALCFFNRQTRYLVFRSNVYEEINILFNSQLKIATPLQRLVWEDDNLEVIQKAFAEMCANIENLSIKN